jgi:micrococcal nuclease
VTIVLVYIIKEKKKIYVIFVDKKKEKIMKKIFLILLVLGMLTVNLFAKKTYGNIILLKENISKVYDGDTITINISHYPDIIGKEIEVRCYGYDTPEIKNKDIIQKEKAIQAREFLKGLIVNSSRIELKNMQRDKYFRILAELYIDNISVADLMIKNNLACAYFGGTKIKQKDK